MEIIQLQNVEWERLGVIIVKKVIRMVIILGFVDLQVDGNGAVLAAKNSGKLKLKDKVKKKKEMANMKKITRILN